MCGLVVWNLAEFTMRSFVLPLRSVILHDVHAPGLHVQTKVCCSIWQEREHFFSNIKRAQSSFNKPLPLSLFISVTGTCSLLLPHGFHGGSWLGGSVCQPWDQSPSKSEPQIMAAHVSSTNLHLQGSFQLL